MSDEIISVTRHGMQTLDLGADPGTLSRLAPNLGQSALPHTWTFAGMSGGASYTYLPSDEALQHSWQFAQFMRNDPMVMEPLELRKRAVALLDWHLEADDPEDPLQAGMADDVTWILRRTPRFMAYRDSLLDAVFYGRAAVVNRLGWAHRGAGRRPLLVIRDWRPLHGDKLIWRWDDGSGDFDVESVGIRISQGATGPAADRYREWARRNGGEVLTTALGTAFFPPPHIRDLITIHRHMVEDGDYHDPRSAARIFGVGVRSRLYWTWFQKQEALKWMLEFLERSAFGIELWYYPAGSEKAKEEMKKAAAERIGNARNILIIPRPAGAEGQAYGVDLIQPNMAGVQALNEVVTDFFGHQIKRYILGQTLTTEPHGTGLGSNLASVHLDTFLQIVKYDARNLEETLTDQLVARLVRWNFPGAEQACPLRLVIETEKPDAQERLSAIATAYGMGLRIRARDVRDLLGLAEPGPKDEVLESRSEAPSPRLDGGGPAP